MGRIYYGWIILGALFVLQILAIGLTALSFGLVVQPLSAEFGLSRSEAYLGLILLLLGTSISAPIIGRLADRFSVRLIVAAGGVFFATGAWLFSTATTPLRIALVVGFLIGPVVNMCGPLIANTLLARWFFRMRGRAFGLVAVAMSLGGFLMVPLFGWLIDNIGWRSSILWLGLVAGGVMILVAIGLLRDYPEDMGLHPDGAAAALPEARSETVANPAARLLSNRVFWLIAVASAFGQAVGMTVTASLVPLAVDEGIAIALAAFLTSATSISGIVAKLGTGFLAERVDVRKIFSVSMLVMAGFVLLLTVPMGFGTMLVLCVVLAGSMGVIVPLGGILLAEHFAHIGYGTAVGLQALIQIPFVLTALYMTGWLYDLWGGYGVAFRIMAVVAVAGAGLVMLVPRYRGVVLADAS